MTTKITTLDICVKTPQLIDSLHENVFFFSNKKIGSDVGDMTFRILNGTLLWNFVQPSRRQFRNYLSGASILYQFLGGARTSICHFFHPSVCLSVHLSVAHHISETIYHLIVNKWYMVYICKMMISPSVFSFFQSIDFLGY